MTRILSTAVYTNLSRDRTEAALAIVSEFESDRPVAARITAEITQSGLPVTSVEDPIRLFPGETSLVQSCEILRVQLWWPHGAGLQPLYRLRLILSTDGGELIDQRLLDFGVVQVEAAPERGEGSVDVPEGLIVNGEPIRPNGWTWEPGNSGVPLPAAREAGVNLLRVAGALESESFYEQCDRLGIMVWQEMPSSLPMDSPAELRDAADALVAQLRNHPCLVLWSADPAHDPAALAELQASVETEDPQCLWAVAAPASPGVAVTAVAPRRAWQTEAEFRADVWLHNTGAERSLLNVVASVVGPENRLLYQENLAAEAPEKASEAVDTLTWRFPPGFAGEFSLELEVIDEEGETIARSRYLHSRSLTD